MVVNEFAECDRERLPSDLFAGAAPGRYVALCQRLCRCDYPSSVVQTDSNETFRQQSHSIDVRRESEDLVDGVRRA